MEQNDLVLNSLSEFVEKNKGRIAEIKTLNPPLHSAVLDALVFLNKRFGNVNVTKSDIIEEKPVEMLEEPVEEVSTSIAEGYEPQVGDTFYHKADNNLIYILSNKFSTDSFEISWIDQNKNEVSISERGEIIKELVDVGTYVIVDRDVNVQGFLKRKSVITPKFKVGDRFSNSYELNKFVEITKIENGLVEYRVTTTYSPPYFESNTIDEINDNIDAGVWVEYKPSTQVAPNFKVGDKFSTLLLSADSFIEVVNISDKKAEYVINNKNSKAHFTDPIETINELIENNTWFKYVPKSTQSTTTKKVKAKNPNQARIKEIKEAIEGLELLAEIGDADAQNEINALKDELKSLK